MASYREVVGALGALIRLVRRQDQGRVIMGGSTFAYAEQVAHEAQAGIVRPIGWTPFERAAMRPADAALRPNGDPNLRAPEIWVNSRYQVLKTDMGNGIIYLSVKRHDQEAIWSWRDLQRIKNELVGPECEGLQMFPAESRKLDEANQYHLWVHADPACRLTFGHHGPRMVADPIAGSGAGQVPFDPDDPFGPGYAPPAAAPAMETR